MARNRAKGDLMKAVSVKAAAKGIVTANIDELHQSCRMIASPSIAWQYLVNCNGFPASRMLTIHGLKKTGKSMLAQSIGGWVLRADGMVHIYDTEHKLSHPVLMAALHWPNKDVLNDTDVKRAVKIYVARTMDAWQTTLVDGTNEYKVKYKKTGDHCPPMCSIVDSAQGANTDGLNKAINDGEALEKDRSGQVAAQQMFKYLRTAAGLGEADQANTTKGYKNWPLSTILVCHANAPDEYGNCTVKGGEAIQYYTSIHLSLRYAPLKDLINPYAPPSARTAEFDVDRVVKGAKGSPDVHHYYVGRMVKIAVEFSGLGADTKNQYITVPIRTIIGEDDNKNKIAAAAIDWYTADAIFLERFAARIENVLDIQCAYVTGLGRCYWAPKLADLGYERGISQSTKLIAWEFGQLIQNNQYIIEALREELGIPTYEYYGEPPTYKYEKFYVPSKPKKEEEEEVIDDGSVTETEG